MRVSWQITYKEKRVPCSKVASLSLQEKHDHNMRMRNFLCLSCLTHTHTNDVKIIYWYSTSRCFRFYWVKFIGWVISGHLRCSTKMYSQFHSCSFCSNRVREIISFCQHASFASLAQHYYWGPVVHSILKCFSSDFGRFCIIVPIQRATVLIDCIWHIAGDSTQKYRADGLTVIKK